MSYPISSDRQSPAPPAYRSCDPVLHALHWALAVCCLAALATEGGGHLLAGALIGLVLIVRLVWGVIGPQSARLAALAPSLPDIALQVSDRLHGEKRYDLAPSPIAAVMALNLLLSLSLLVLTGAALPATGSAQLAEAHEALVVWLNVSVAAHLAGVVWASLHYRVNLVWTLLSGIKPLPDDLYWRDDPQSPAAAAPPCAGDSGANP
ncbi:cytochrome b/b6 domain-containing protein [Marinovum sp.]|uniref:cytochrome b/b6 domain-containing protein n=1 Tax=Marinovum sp. TaxID=2024839 RepID=UPI002B2732A0|nr:cytochrome b/b6 domain-containing protein [Marinovum sp.]